MRDGRASRGLAHRLEHHVLYRSHRRGVEPHRTGESRVHDAAFAETALDRLRESAVVGDAWVHHRDGGEVGHAPDERRSHVDRPCALVAGAREVEREPVALFDGCDVQADRLRGVDDVVDPRLRLGYAVGPLGEVAADAPLDALHDVAECGSERLAAVLVRERLQPCRSDAPQRARLCSKVPDDEFRCAAVRPQELRDLLVHRAAALEEHGHDLQAVAKHVPRDGVARTGRLSADVRLVPHAGAERDDLALVEHRQHDDHVVRVRAAGVVRVVGQVTVAVLHLFEGVEIENALHAVRVRAEVSGQGRVLTNDRAGYVGDACGEVVRFADDGGEAGAEHRGLHLAHDAVQPRADDFLGDDVSGGHGRFAQATWPTRLTLMRPLDFFA